MRISEACIRPPMMTTLITASLIVVGVFAYRLLAVAALPADEAFRNGVQLVRAGDVKGGVSALEYAAKRGHVIAQWKLGRMLADGDQVARDDRRAFRYFQDLVENHSDDGLGTPQSRYVANAFVSLGDYYVSGITG